MKHTCQWLLFSMALGSALAAPCSIHTKIDDVAGCECPAGELGGAVDCSVEQVRPTLLLFFCGGKEAPASMPKYSPV